MEKKAETENMDDDGASPAGTEDSLTASLTGSGRVRPHISLRIPAPITVSPGSPGSRPPSHFYSAPMTPTLVVNPMDGGFNPIIAYPNKAGEFISKQFLSFRDFTLKSAKSGLSVGEKASIWMYGKVWALSRKWFTHIFLFLIIAAYSLLGGFLFHTIEGRAEQKNVIDIIQHRKDVLLEIRQFFREFSPMESDEDEQRWLGRSTQAIREYEGVLLEYFKQDTHIMSKGDKPVWDFWSSVFFCGTIFTTIGYGHIAPVTTTGRALTIAYSIIGIPLFLLLLADFGKLFTRSIKFLWAFVRRVYYTGSCKKVRRTAPVQEVMKGVQMVYDMALLRRPSQMQSDNPEGGNQVPPMTPASPGDAPSTPALSAFAVDDEFNLPITVAIVILLIYIFMGAAVFYIWETDWTFFDAFYFVFISMSTIGFGDLVPANQMYMMASIVYLAFGLALTSMCINVVQEKLSDTFRQASAKIGATIGLKVCEDDGTVEPASPTHVEIAEVHKTPSTQI
ncbi:TWiK family of potassium channels protein 18 isoform X3 [Rhodnius prolixus]|uniref:TWiK family of potassium channels protein 18 isoform X3 n=1 Tax=Rhodnius prolixus TaxID=13249 RepID=UPI003D189EC2